MVTTRGRQWTVALCLVGLTACMPTVGGTDPATEPGTTGANRSPGAGHSAAAGEIRLFGGNFAPQGWEYADGKELSIQKHERLFAVLGSAYGGDGQTTFRLPKLPTVKADDLDKQYLIAVDGVAPRFEGGGEGLSGGLLGEIRLWPADRTPVGWLPCDGAELAIGDHMALFEILRTRFGGDGRTTFKVPSLSPVGDARYLINVAGQWPMSGTWPQTDPMVGEIGLFAGREAPAGFVFCAGQVLPVQPHIALFSVISHQYGAVMSAGSINWNAFKLPELTLADQPAVRYTIAVEGDFPSRP